MPSPSMHLPLLRPLKTQYRQRADRSSGSHEIVHNLVCTGHAAWKRGCESECHPFIVPPVQLERTTASQIGAGVMVSIERHLLNNVGFETWLQTLSATYSRLNVFFMADSASANIKLTWKLSAWIQKKGKEYGLDVSVHYHPCMLHQVARIIVSGRAACGLTNLFNKFLIVEAAAFLLWVFPCLQRQTNNGASYAMVFKSCFPHLPHYNFPHQR